MSEDSPHYKHPARRAVFVVSRVLPRVLPSLPPAARRDGEEDEQDDDEEEDVRTPACNPLWLVRFCFLDFLRMVWCVSVSGRGFDPVATGRLSGHNVDYPRTRWP